MQQFLNEATIDSVLLAALELFVDQATDRVYFSLALNPDSLFRILSRSFGEKSAARQNPEWRAWVNFSLLLDEYEDWGTKQKKEN